MSEPTSVPAAAEGPWYREGLRFTCTQCGHCCTGSPGFVWVSEEDLRRIAEFRGEPAAQVQKLYARPAERGLTLREKSNGDCVFYASGQGCTIYPVRPPQCRTWPFWESSVHSPEAWAKTCEVCPGSGRGELIPVEELVRRIKVIRL